MVTITLTETEQKILVDMLNRLGDHMSNSGCNDYEIPASLESRQLLIDAYRHNFEPGPYTDDDDWMPNLRVYKGQYSCSDSILLDYLKSKIEVGR